MRTYTGSQSVLNVPDLKIYAGDTIMMIAEVPEGAKMRVAPFGDPNAYAFVPEIMRFARYDLAPSLSTMGAYLDTPVEVVIIDADGVEIDAYMVMFEYYRGKTFASRTHHAEGTAFGSMFSFPTTGVITWPDGTSERYSSGFAYAPTDCGVVHFEADGRPGYKAFDELTGEHLTQVGLQLWNGGAMVNIIDFDGFAWSLRSNGARWMQSYSPLDVDWGNILRGNPLGYDIGFDGLVVVPTDEVRVVGLDRIPFARFLVGTPAEECYISEIRYSRSATSVVFGINGGGEVVEDHTGSEHCTLSALFGAPLYTYTAHGSYCVAPSLDVWRADVTTQEQAALLHLYSSLMGDGTYVAYLANSQGYTRPATVWTDIMNDSSPFNGQSVAVVGGQSFTLVGGRALYYIPPVSPHALYANADDVSRVCTFAQIERIDTIVASYSPLHLLQADPSTTTATTDSIQAEPVERYGSLSAFFDILPATIYPDGYPWGLRRGNMFSSYDMEARAGEIYRGSIERGFDVASGYDVEMHPVCDRPDNVLLEYINADGCYRLVSAKVVSVTTSHEAMSLKNSGYRGNAANIQDYADVKSYAQGFTTGLAQRLTVAVCDIPRDFYLEDIQMQRDLVIYPYAAAEPMSCTLEDMEVVRDEETRDFVLTFLIQA